ncbi:MAG: hypothetical protein ACT4OS_09425 [Acidimicrobiales bacterium]
MMRTQISLTPEGRQLLEDAAVRTGLSMSALIREAVQTVYGTGKSRQDSLDAIAVSAGVWKSQEDGGQREGGEVFTERLRSARRLQESRLSLPASL